MSMLNHFFDYKPEVLALDEKAMELCQPYFHHAEEIRDFNQRQNFGFIIEKVV